MKLVAVAVGLIFLAMGLVLAFWPILLHRVTYPGGRLAPGQGDPAGWGLATATEVRLETEDGVGLHGWWIPGVRPGRQEAGVPGGGSGVAEPGACGAVIYFHGNANTIAPRAWLGRRLSERGLDVLLFDYRGYGLSEGRPSGRGLRRDARAAWDHVVEARGIPPDRIILMGHSLGSAVATELALEHAPAALVLGAPFPHFPALFRHHAPWIPAGLLPWRDGRYAAGSRIAEVHAPVLVAVGERDAVIPPALSRGVYDAAPEPRRLVVTPADHATLMAHPDVWRAIDGLLRETLGCA